MKKLFTLIFFAFFAQGILAQGNTFPEFVVFGDSSEYKLAQSGDLNNDGWPDVVAIRADFFLEIWMKDTIVVDSFELVHSLNLNANPKALLVVDFDGDGNLDIGTTIFDSTFSYDMLHMYYGTGFGGFQFEQALPLYGVVDDMHFADNDGDNIPDIMATGFNNGIFINIKGPSYNVVDTVHIPISGNTKIASGIIGSTLNGPRVFINFAQNDNVNIIEYNMTNGGMTFVREYTHNLEPVTGYPSCRDIEISDFDGDGLDDINATYGGNTGYHIWWKYGVESQQDTMRVDAIPMALKAGDFDGDGLDELILVNAGQNLMTYINDDSSQSFMSPIADTPHNDAIDVADFDGDGNEDIITVGKNWGLVYIKNNGQWNTLDDPKLENNFLKLYPNPVHNQLIITGFSNENQHIQIYNPVGQIIYYESTSGVDSYSVEIGSFESGVYVVDINGQRFKIVKN